MSQHAIAGARKRVLVVFGTRPEAIKLLPVIQSLSARDDVVVRTCATGQHGDLIGQILQIAGICPDHDLKLMRPGQSLDRLTARLLTGVGAVLDRDPVDRVVVQGDTATALAASLAAYHRRLPVAHVEAGLRSGDIYRPWPEEANRRIIAAVADLHFAPTETAAQALAREGVTAGVHVTGNTVIDALHATRAAIAQRPELARAAEALRERIGARRMILVTTHRRESRGAGLARIAAALARLAARDDVAIVLPVHPGVAAGVHELLGARSNVILTAPLDYPDFVRALSLAQLVLTDSGGVQEEAPALGKPVLVLRDTTERPEGVAAGTARLVGTDTDLIVESVTRLLDDPCAYAAMAQAHSPYGDGRAAARIAALIAAAPVARAD